MWRGVQIRRTIGQVLKEKVEAAAMVSRIWRSKRRIQTFRTLAFDYKNFMATKVQRYMKGLMGYRDGQLRRKVKAMSDLDGWLQIRRGHMLLDAQIVIAHAWRKFMKFKAIKVKKAALAAKRKKERDAADKLKKQKSGVASNVKGATIKGKTKKKTTAADATSPTMPSIKEITKEAGNAKMQLTGQISDMNTSGQYSQEDTKTGFNPV